mmetsp:Transcript_8546/g.19690  ORF Transcript_8546/g.19690 Transcript_8546/m.19690 type:complete len:224 (-) Transcript_8546:1342-2013(-)
MEVLILVPLTGVGKHLVELQRVRGFLARRGDVGPLQKLPPHLVRHLPVAVHVKCPFELSEDCSPGSLCHSRTLAGCLSALVLGLHHHITRRTRLACPREVLDPESLGPGGNLVHLCHVRAGVVLAGLDKGGEHVRHLLRRNTRKHNTLRNRRKRHRRLGGLCLALYVYNVVEYSIPTSCEIQAGQGVSWSSRGTALLLPAVLVWLERRLPSLGTLRPLRGGSL